MRHFIVVVKTRVRLSALPAASHPLGPNKKSRKSDHCHTCKNLTPNSFACHTYKSKGDRVLCLPHIFQMNGGILVMVNQVLA